jgi:hypothetical protein
LKRVEEAMSARARCLYHAVKGVGVTVIQQHSNPRTQCTIYSKDLSVNNHTSFDTDKISGETYPRGCCSSPSPIAQNSVAPRPCILLQSFLAGQQNFSYAVSPSPNTANDKSSNKSFGRSERRSLFHSKVIERGSIPEPVVDTTNITRLCEISSC